MMTGVALVPMLCRMGSLCRIPLACLILLVAGCGNSATPAPTTGVVVDSTTVPGPSVTVDTTVTPTASVAPSSSPPPPPPATSAEKIAAAERSGAIDHETAILDRLFAVFGDPRLPDDLRGERSEDLGALKEARQALATLSPAGQAIVRSYLVRPTDPASYWMQEPPGTGATGAPSSSASDGLLPERIGAAARRAPRVASATQCSNGWLSQQVSPNIPVMIWSQCFGSLVSAQAGLAEARGDMAALWGPETALMGVPPGDQNFPNDGYVDTPETGDGLIDIYLLDSASPAGNPRDFDIGTSYGVTAWTPPFTGTPGSKSAAGYIVIKPGLRGLDLESTLAHEFFHVLEYGINFEGLNYCPVAGPASCQGVFKDWFWMVEASATWAEFNFVPAARATTDGPYDRFRNWRSTWQGLAEQAGNNPYHSWMWPLFVQQQAGTPSVGAIWQAYRGKAGFRQLQAATDSIVPFAQSLREYAVRGWNELLLPGDPLAKHYFDPSLDQNFPRDKPDSYRRLDDLAMIADGQGPHIEELSIDSLATSYQSFGPSGVAHTLVLDFTALAPEIDVAAIVHLQDGTWERRDLPDAETTWCLDTPKDAIDRGYLVFANHDLSPPTMLTRDWSWDAREQGCGTSEGTLKYSFLDVAPGIGERGSRSEVDATVQVHLKANDGTTGYGAQFLNDGSTYGVTTAWTAVFPPGPDGCSPKQKGVGTPNGALAIDSVNAGTWINDDGVSVLGVSISLPVHEEIAEDWCALGTGHSTYDYPLQYPECDGVESGSTGDLQRFVFDCKYQSGSVSWAVSGTVLIRR